MNKTEPAERLRFNIDTMRTVMSAPFEWFEQFGVLHEGRPTRRGTARHIYIDRGSNVLGVAHLDSVCSFTGFWVNHEYIACPTIDNRLGVWLMLYGLPSLGLNFDVLLTENEESGMSTAQDFEPPKQYNWAFSFDRTGDDVVTYHYDDKEFNATLARYELYSGWGSYSDISELELGAKCVNVGCGMHDYHSKFAYCRLSELALQVKRFATFFVDHECIHLPHSGGRWKLRDWDDYHQGGYTGIGSEYHDDYYYADDHGTVSYALTRISKRTPWDRIDRYYAKLATEYPAEWFLDAEDADEWYYNHMMGDINAVEPDDEEAELYFDGILELCQECDGLFTRGDVDRYHSLDRRLCRACFYYAAVAMVTAEEN